MQTEDLLSLGAIMVSITGLVGLVLLESFEQPVGTTIGEISKATDGSTLVFRARIEKWRALRDFDRLELSDGNTVSATASKKLGLDWNQSGVFEFVARKGRSPKQPITIVGAKRVD